MLVWERLFRSRFDRFELTTSDFRFSFLTLVREWLCHVDLTDWLWFEFRNLFVDVFLSVFFLLTLKLSWRNDCLIFVLIDLRLESPCSYFHFFKVEVNVERLFPLALTDSDSSFEMPFFSNVSLAWSFRDSDYLALILIRVLKVHVSIFPILFRSKLVWERLCLLRFGYAVLGRVSQPVFRFFYVFVLFFTLKQVWKQLSRVSLDWFNFQKFVFLDL